ncbi:MAG: DUF3048 domain-containing protein [Candidatus Microsaccharimonas sp.]
MFTRKQPQVVIDEPLQLTPIGGNSGLSVKQNWFKKHKKLTIIFGVVGGILIVGGSSAAFYFLNQKPEQSAIVASSPQPEPEPVKYYSQLTGNEVANEAASTQAVTGIMIENSPDARPQSGIKDSGVVFEAIAEGGITRFLVLYQEQKPQLIGPVRSVRLYYVDWVAAFNASVSHIGGSAAALAEVRNGSYRDIDQFFNAASYWRATDRYAPHNVYTSFEKLDALNAAKGHTTSNFTGFARKDTKPAETPTATTIDITISGPLYNSQYTYNATTNTYDRSQGGAPHLDREAGQISPRVVIGMMVDQTTVFEDGYRESINAIGSGKAYIFQDGTAQEVTWTKPSKTEQISFTDANGAKVELARGQTWISAIPNTTGRVVWQ